MAPGVNFLYYCSIKDVQEKIQLAQPSWTVSGRTADDPLIRRAILSAYSSLNAKAKKGGYTVPVTNATKTTISAAITAADTAIAKDVASSTGFVVGSTVRVHGLLDSATLYKDEFTSIVVVASATNVTFEFFENAYDTGATMELCTEGYLWLRDCNIMGAAYNVLSGLTVGQARSKNDRLPELRADWKDCLKDLQEGTIDLDGLTIGLKFISTYHTDNPSAADHGPCITTEERY